MKVFPSWIDESENSFSWSSVPIHAGLLDWFQSRIDYFDSEP